ncbi:hypothetical protein B7L66_19420 [Xanthomonas citri pv. citri]|nr:hypothetical protein B7L66_19420 [Xanthomonas citri pv. citri]CEE24162.1 hypothetical protein XAC908_1100066 [Xanthomonas citri pv. citri]
MIRLTWEKGVIWRRWEKDVVWRMWEKGVIRFGSGILGMDPSPGICSAPRSAVGFPRRRRPITPPSRTNHDFLLPRAGEGARRADEVP